MSKLAGVFYFDLRPITPADEARMLATHAGHDRVLDLGAVTDVATILAAQHAVAAVHGSEELRRYVVELAAATRSDARVELGASPRAGLLLFRAAKGLAALEARDHVLPDDVQALAVPVLRHRLLMAPGSAADDREVTIRDAVERVPAL